MNRWTRRGLAWGGLALVILVGAGLTAIRAIPGLVEQRIRQEITGAAASVGLQSNIGTIALDWRRVRVRVSPVAIFGARGPGEPALLEVRSLELSLRWRALWRGRIELDTIVAEAPQVAILFRADGTTNLPLRFDGQDPDRLFALGISRIALNDGELRFGDRRIRLNLTIDGVRSAVRFDAARRTYSGQLTADRIAGVPIPLRLDAVFEVHPDRVDVTSFRVEGTQSRVDGSASFRNWQRLEGEFQARIAAAVKEARLVPRWDFIDEGFFSASLAGTLTDQWRLSGPMQLSGTQLKLGGQTFQRLSASAEGVWEGPELQFHDLVIQADQGRVTGTATVQSLRDYRLDLALTQFPGPEGWNTSASGQLRLAGGVRGLETLAAQVRLTPGAGSGPPLAGTLDLDAEVLSRRIHLRQVEIRSGQTTLEARGELDRRVEVDLRTGRLDDLRDLAGALQQPLPEFPVQLRGSIAAFRGVVTGQGQDLRAQGTVRTGALATPYGELESVAAAFTAYPTRIDLASVALAHPAGRVSGQGKIHWNPGQPYEEATIAGELAAPALRLDRLDSRLGGLGGLRAQFQGTARTPSVSGELQIRQPRWTSWQADQLAVRFRGSPERLVWEGLRLERGANSLTGNGSWSPAAVELNLAAPSWNLTGQTPVPFLTTGNGSARAILVRDPGGWRPRYLTAAIELTGRGGLRTTIDAQTAGNRLAVKGTARAGDSRLDLDGEWPLEAGSRGAGMIRIRELTLRTAYTLLGREAPPFEGRAQGQARVAGVLLDPGTWLAEVTLPRVEFAPRPDAIPPGLTREDLTLRNQGDVLLVAGPSAIVAQRARFVAKDTELSGQGNVAFRRRSAWNLLLEGKASLAVASTFRPDLISSGTSVVTARLRGPLAAPDLDGRMELTKASLFVRGLSNGLDQVNGSLRFDRGRVNIESLTGQSGGGNVRLSGFLGFSSDLAYQLQAQLNQVRIRYPDGVSTTANAALALTGTRRRSLLSGTVTILRANVAPTTDMAQLLAPGPAPAPAAPENELLAGLRYDVRVETAQSAEFITQLTRNVEADFDLRLRGTIERPSLLGRISITQGQLQFFGTVYTINRGEIDFLNPVRIDPQMDLDLETRVRGINVSLRFSGPPNKMNMSYRSDPPLQSSEILALLAVGRAPNLSTPASGPALNSRDLLSSGGNAVLDSAVTNGVNSPLQRFFGVTRLKLDPQLIGLDNTPQARVSFEQQISRDVTVTYVQALNRAQQQLVRVQWDWSREWSAIATRDENGVLSVDFVYKRSLR